MKKHLSTPLLILYKHREINISAAPGLMIHHSIHLFLNFYHVIQMGHTHLRLRYDEFTILTL